MSQQRTIAAVTLTAGTPTPVYTGTVTAAASFSITNNVATIILGSALPAVGYNPGSYQGSGFPVGGDQVTLWAFTTATYFNGKTVTVIANNPVAKSFSFAFTHANVGSTADTGNTAVAPTEQYRSVRLEVDQSAGAGKIFVGDLNVSSSQYAECLSLTAQIAAVIASGTVPPERIMCDTSVSTTKVQVSLMY